MTDNTNLPQLSEISPAEELNTLTLNYLSQPYTADVTRLRRSHIAKLKAMQLRGIRGSAQNFDSLEVDLETMTANSFAVTNELIKIYFALPENADLDMCDRAEVEKVEAVIAKLSPLTSGAINT